MAFPLSLKFSVLKQFSYFFNQNIILTSNLGELYAPRKASPPLTLLTPAVRLKIPVKSLGPKGHPLISRHTPLLADKSPSLEQRHTPLLVDKTPLVEHNIISMVQGRTLLPTPITDSFAVTTTAGGGNNRLVLVDSGANVLYAESKKNLSNVRAADAQIEITGVNGTSMAQRVGTLPSMVTNTGHPIFLGDDCVISNEQDVQNREDPRSIVTPKHLNENGISVYFANGTTVLLLADTVELKGTVIHQEKFSGGLALINLRDHRGGG